jgi:hypothetical protein
MGTLAETLTLAHVGHPAPLPSLAYKRGLRARLRTQTIPSNLLDIIPLPMSLSIVVDVDAGKLQSTGGATASGRRWRNGRWEVDEPSRCDLFCFPNVEPASSTLQPIAALFSAERRWVPLETRKTTTYVPVQDRLSSDQRGLLPEFFFFPLPPIRVQPNGPAQRCLCVRPRLKKRYLGLANFRNSFQMLS